MYQTIQSLIGVYIHNFMSTGEVNIDFLLENEATQGADTHKTAH